MNPKVSVIIPTYERSDYLKRAIDSVLNQTYKNIEIIVVDDNNPNSEYRKLTEEVMKEYSMSSKIKYLRHEKNKNGAAARNTGIRNSHGEYISFLDDDDEFLKDKIELQVKKMESLDSTWAACYTGYIKKNSENFVQNSSENREGNLLVEALMRSLFIVAGSNLMVRRSVVEEINGFDESFKRNQDLEFLVRILEKYKLAYVDSISLIIHYEIRNYYRSFEELIAIDNLYLDKFKKSIDKLNPNDKRKVIYMIYLDRLRYSVARKKYREALKILIKTPPLLVLRYILYLLKRYITKKSFGFDLK